MLKNILEKQNNRIYAIIGDSKRGAITIDLAVFNIKEIVKDSIKEAIEETIMVKPIFWEDEDHIVGGYISKKELNENIKKFLEN